MDEGSPVKMSHHAITLRGVSKRFRRHQNVRQRLLHMLRVNHAPEIIWALADVDLAIHHGESVAIVGANGSGKSTLFNLIAGGTNPTGGRVHVDGRVGAIVDLGFGFHPGWTGRENAEFHVRLSHPSREDRAALVAEIAEFADIGDAFDQPLRQYSTGMVMRLGFAAAIAGEPDILLVDEALAVGDSGFQQKSYRWIEDFRRRGGTLLIVTHRLDILPQLTDRAILIDQGRVIADGTPKSVIHQYAQQIFGAGGKAAQAARKIGTGGAQLMWTAGADDAPLVMGGTGADICFRVRFDRAFANPTYGINIRTIEGVLLSHVNSQMRGVGPSPVLAGDVVDVAIHLPTSLPAGEYGIDLMVHDGDGQYVVIDGQMDALRLHILGERQQLGLFDLNVEFAIRPLAAEAGC